MTNITIIQIDERLITEPPSDPEQDEYGLPHES